MDVLDLEALKVEARSEAQGMVQAIALEFLRPLLLARMVRDVLALPPRLRRAALADEEIGPLVKQAIAGAKGLRESAG